MFPNLRVLALNPPGFPGAAIGSDALRSGYEGGLALEYASVTRARRAIHGMADAGHSWWASVSQLDETWRPLLLEAKACGLQGLLLCHDTTRDIEADLRWAREQGFKVLVEVTSLADAQHADTLGVDALVIKGNEAGGLIGEETTFILLQRVIPQVKVPVWARGGIGLYTAAAACSAGACGVILDWQLGLTVESELPESIKARLRRMDGGETSVLGQDVGERYRAYKRPGEKGFDVLLDLEKTILRDEEVTRDQLSAWHDAVHQRINDEREGEQLLLISQDASLSACLADRFGHVGAICEAIVRQAHSQCRLAIEQEALRPEGPMAVSHGTKYPIVQGPMTRVSDTADFALSVAEGGGLPFLALALLRGPQVDKLLEETKGKLGGLSWGVGILGFVPRELRDEQLEAVRKHHPPYAIIAGGRPDQALQLEKEGIPTYLHVPSPGLLKMFLDAGSRRFIFEGRECGGHVGPRSSLVLWESMIQVLLDHLAVTKTPASDCHVLFAGGIHDARSAMMVAALAAPLVEYGVRIGVLMGTSYLFTREAVTAGAIVQGFQDEALKCGETVLLESGVGHATRAARTDFARQFASLKRQLVRRGATADETRDALEALNLGRLRMASKGVRRAENEEERQLGRYIQLDEGAQRNEGMYMIGQVAALHSSVCTVGELHENVSRGGVELLREMAPPRMSMPIDRPCDIAIVGMDCIFPHAEDLDAYWENILNKVDALEEIPAERWDWKLYFDSDRSARDKVYSRWGGFIKSIAFDPAKYGMPPNVIPSVEPLQLLVLEVVRRAIENAGYGSRPFNRAKTSVILGAGGGVADRGNGYGFRSLLPYFMTQAGGTSAEARQLIDRLEGVLPEWTEDSFPGLLMNVASGRVANRFDFGGTNYTVDAACASSLAAVRQGVLELITGSSDTVIVGGADTMQSPFAYLCFSKTQALSPTGKSRSFDAGADGIVTSEGIAALVLKRLDDAERDGDRIFAVIKGIGTSSDGRNKGLTAPRPEGQVRGMMRAYDQAGYCPSTVGLFEGHATGTVAGDKAEIESMSAIARQSGARPASIAVGSVKSMIGHTKCTAGVAGLIKAAMALHTRVLPPTLNAEKPNPGLGENSPLYLSTELRPWFRGAESTPRRAGVSAFGFGGTNFHATIEEYAPASGIAQERPASRHWPAELLAWRAESADSLTKAIDQIATALEQGAEPEIPDLAAAICRAHAGGDGSHALSIVATSLDDLKKKLASAREALQQGKSEIKDPRGVYYTSAPLAKDAKVAFLFSGQGSQKVNMLCDLTVHYPAVRPIWERADRVMGEQLGKPLSRFVYPPPVFTDEERQALQKELTQTNVAQAAMGAADMAVLRVLSDLGIRADMACGHSYGEYVALCAAGVIGFEDLIRVSEARGRLIAEAGEKNPGTMLAIFADEKTVLPLLGEVSDVEIANLNSPVQTVVTGTKPGIDAMAACCAEKGIEARIIQVSCAFHSKLVSDAQRPLGEFLEQIEFRSPRYPVYANTTGTPHRQDGNTIRRMLIDHMVKPVRFLDNLNAMYDAGARVFIEVGPGKTLSTLAEFTFMKKGCVIVTPDQPGRHGLVSLEHALAQLHVAGVRFHPARLTRQRVRTTLDLRRLVEQTKPAPPSLTTWMIDGSRSIPLNPKFAKAVAKAPAGGNQNTKRSQTAPDAATISAPVVTPAGGTDGAKDENTGKGQNLMNNGSSHASAPGHQVAPGHAPPNQAGLPPAAPPGMPVPGYTGQGADAVLAGYQHLMARFLESQKQIMLAYLQAGHGYGQQAPAPQPAVQVPFRQQAAPWPQITPPQASPPAALQPAPATQRQVESSLQPAAPAAPVVIQAPSEPEPVAPPPTATSDRLTRASLTEHLVNIVADRTGYPPEMLDLDLDLEADLGIDSIKRVEILGSLQNENVLPQDESAEHRMEELAKLKTLNAIINWIIEQAETAGDENASVTEAEPMEVSALTETADAPRMVLNPFETAPPQVAPDVLAGGAILITGDEQGVATALAGRLEQLHIPAAILWPQRDKRDDGDHARIDFTDRESLAFEVDQVRRRHGRIAAMVHLQPLSGEMIPRNMAPDAWREQLDNELYGLFHLTQLVEKDLRREPSGMLLGVTRMGGSFGSLDREGPAFHPVHGGVAGFVKAMSREWNDATARMIDVDHDAAVDTIVEIVLAELSLRDGVNEAGFRAGARVTLQPTIVGTSQRSQQIELGSDDVVLITGGAKGITADIAIELAHQFKPTLVLVGRSSLPDDEEPADTATFTDAPSLKKVIMQRIQRSGEKPAPAMVERAFRKLMGEREIRASLAAMKQAGATVHYFSADVCDREAFGALIDGIYARFGRIDGVVHGAGVTADKFLADKTPEAFESVLAPKVDGAFTLAAKLKADALKFMFFFSSVTARYGNRGQCDYAAANEALNKLALWLNARWPGRVASLNWGPWESAAGSGGMVSAELAKQFEKAGVVMITKSAGRRLFIQELLYGRKDEVEVIFGGPLIGANAVRIEQATTLPVDGPAVELPLMNCRAKVIRNTDGTVVVDLPVNTTQDLYLLDHQLDGKPVMPMAMVLELLSEVVSAGWPHMRPVSINEFRLLRGMVLDKGDGILRVTATPGARDADSMRVELRVEVLTDKPHLAYTGAVELSTTLPSPMPAISHEPADAKPFPMDVTAAYDLWLFHGPLFAGITEINSIGSDAIVGRLTPSSPSRCLARTAKKDWLIDPVIIDSGLQMMILWARSHWDMTPLPSRLGRYHRLSESMHEEVRCEVRIRPESRQPVIHADLLFINSEGKLIGWMEDMEVTCSRALNRLSASSVIEGES